MNKSLIMTIVFTCVCAVAYTQVNFVKNPSFEDTVKCPDEINEIGRAKYWNCAVDTAGSIDGLQFFAPEYYNSCASTDADVGVPINLTSIQYPHTGTAYIGAHLYYDKTSPPPPFVSPNWRDYAQGHLHKALTAGKTYCIGFWLNLAETSGFAHNSISAYLDNGDINKHSPAGDMITDVIPQFATTTIVKDTQNWVKVEGSFVANGTETHITIGNFAKQADIDTDATPYFVSLYQYSYYLIDDISVVPIDAKANAGTDRWVEQGKTTQIGPIEDSTARGMDCKWYKKGLLIDSGNVISVAASAIKYAVDTYVVVQTICGNITRDTMLLRTVGTGIPLLGGVRGGFSIYPNPSNGTITIASLQGTTSPALAGKQSTIAKVYDLLGRVIYHKQISFSNNEASIDLDAADGIYILELSDDEGTIYRQKIEMRK